MAVIAKLDDMGAVGHAARAPKAGQPKELMDFSVTKGDNGGIVIRESYKTKTPEGRRAGHSFPISNNFKENPFGPDDGPKATAHIADLLSQMTGGAMQPDAGEEAGEAAPPPRPPMGGGPPPPAAAIVTPNRVRAVTPGASVTARRPLY